MADSLAAATQQVADLVDSLKLEDPPKDSNGTELQSSTDASALESKPATEGSVTKESKTQLDAKDPRPFYPSNPYYGYYYPGHETAGKEWEDQTRFAGADGVDVQYPSAPASENGSVVYYPSYGYGQNPYNPYNPYIPGAMIGTEGQYMGQRPYYTGQFQQPPASAGYFQPLPVHPPRPETGHMPPGKANGNAGGKGANKAGLKDGPKGMQPGASLPRNFRPMSQIQLNQQQGPVNGVTFQAKDTMHFRKFNPGFNQGKMLMPYGNMNGMAYKHNIRPRGKFFGYHGNENWNFDGLNEQNRGPRTNRPKGYQNPSDVRNSGSQGAAANGEVQTDKSQYNLESFSVDYDAAKFFVIKSYSEDDVHQSIKYNVWASTPNGNKRLDGAYQEAQKLSTESNKDCPVFLFFSVNASGQFCGVAEMIGSVDFEKSMDFWQQDKWNGFFPVKWHMIKDIPNSQFRQIILENNDNKPVTNSRDTQEIKFHQGVEMLKIFKNYILKTSILDDFMFYEGRQKQMKEKKLRQQALQQQLDACGPVPQKAVAKENGFKNHDDKSSGLKVPSVAANGHQLPDSISLINGDSTVSGETKDSVQGSDVTKTGSEELQVENPNVLMVGSVAC